MTREQPLVSVLICSFNPNYEYLVAAMQSILTQSYTNLEVVFVNDGSTIEGVKHFIESFDDERIRFIDNKENKGLTKCLNQGLEFCRGEFIARMDDDDICMPRRIEEQVAAMQTDENIQVLGSDAEVFGSESRISHYLLANTRQEQQVELFFRNVGLAHPTVMFRASFLREHQLTYDIRYEKAQDYGLWVDCVCYSRLYCLNQTLLRYRVHPHQASKLSRDKQCSAMKKIRYEQLLRLGLEPTDEEETLHQFFCDDVMEELVKSFDELNKWVYRLISANSKTGYLDKKAFKKKLRRKLLPLYGFLFQKKGVASSVGAIIKNISTLFALI